jgi:glycosyltransferase involved in cell wall biosynthesis
MMRIIVVGPTPPPYHGVSVATELVLEAFRQSPNGFRIQHLNTTDRRDLSNLGRFDVTNLLLAFRHGAQFLLQLLGGRADVVYVPISQSTLPLLRDFLFLIPAQLQGAKLILHLHGSAFGDFFRSAGRSMQSLIRYIFGKAHRVIVLGENLREIFGGVVPRDRVQVVPNGIVDFAGGHPRPPTDGIFRVLFLSTLMREKGFFDLLAVIPQLCAIGRPIKFMFVGQWLRRSEKLEAEEFIQRHGIGQHIEFLGTVEPPAKYALLARADVFVLPSHNEGLPLSLLEAMCAGLPVIATPVGCIPEVITDGKNGFLIHRNSSQQLAEKLAALLADPDLCRQMGAASREVFLSRYTFPHFRDRFLQVFETAKDGLDQ